MDNARLAPDTVQPPLIPLHNLARKKSPLSGQNSHLERHSRHHNHHHRCSYGSVQDDARSFVSFIPPRRPASILTGDMNHAADRHPRKLVLCFDGTGKNFQGDEGDSNILKIFRMLDRTAGDQYHYYQPGIGTYVVSGDLSPTSIKARLRSFYLKAKDSAFGSSFDQHVVGGYRFLMRFYNPGDEIYIFGFSRGSYIARFLAEMLDFVGLLSHGNEEMVHFAWQAFSQWQCRRNDNSQKGTERKKDMYTFMKGFRETFSRPVRRIQFLGLFDTVNSVPRFETAWMERSKFPYTARSSAKVIRHAVSIDERRAKFRQDLIYQSANGSSKKHRDARQVLHDVHEKYRARRHSLQAAVSSVIHHQSGAEEKPRGRLQSQLSDMTGSGDENTEDAENPAPYRAHSRSRSRDSHSLRDDVSEYGHAGLAHIHDDNDVPQDISEVWFSGDHADIGGGWDATHGGKMASHVPLTWMVREAMRAGLTFDAEKVVALGCSDAVDSKWAANVNEPFAEHPSAATKHSRGLSSVSGVDDIDPLQPAPPPPNIRINSEDKTGTAGSPTETPVNYTDGQEPKDGSMVDVRLGTPCSKFHEMLYKAQIAPTHDSLEFNRGNNAATVISWNIVEYLPFRRMDLQSDGSWKPIRWPLPCGETRDIPDNVLVHGSVLRRMRRDPSYRPGNLIVGGGGRGCRVAPEHYGMGSWECVAEEGDPIGEVWMKKTQA